MSTHPKPQGWKHLHIYIEPEYWELLQALAKIDAEGAFGPRSNQSATLRRLIVQEYERRFGFADLALDRARKLARARNQNKPSDRRVERSKNRK